MSLSPAFVFSVSTVRFDFGLRHASAWATKPRRDRRFCD